MTTSIAFLKNTYKRITGFESIRKPLILQCSLFYDIYLVAKDPLKLKNSINIFLKVSMILYIIFNH